jgi:predicted GIY-YIG superfamily endonuclease
MWYVYIIRSIGFPDQEYTGATADLKQRITDHSAGKSTHTAKFKPWKLVWYCAFPDKYKALAFEKYLKSHSGRAFAKKASLVPLMRSSACARGNISRLDGASTILIGDVGC